MSRLEVLLWIAGAGAFGGFVDGLLFPRTYQLRLGKFTRDLGSIGDALVGATAAVAIFAVAGAVFTESVKVTNLQATDEFLKVVAWGVLSGFAGLRVLRPLTDKLVMEVAGKAAREAVEQETVKGREAAVHIQSGEALLTKYDFASSDPAWPKSRAAELQTFLEVAENKFRAALATDPENADAVRGTAKVLKRRAEAVRDQDPARARELMEEAVSVLSRLVAHNPGYALGYYNRACYRDLLAGERSQVLADLEAAFGLNPALRDLALTDPDLRRIRATAEFATLAGSRAPAAPVPPSTAGPRGASRRKRPRAPAG